MVIDLAAYGERQYGQAGHYSNTEPVHFCQTMDLLVEDTFEPRHNKHIGPSFKIFASWKKHIGPNIHIFARPFLISYGGIRI